MAGTSDGAKKAVKTIKKLYGEDHYAKLGKASDVSWKRNGRKPKGFGAATPEQRREWGSRGGKNSKRLKRSSK